MFISVGQDWRFADSNLTLTLWGRGDSQKWARSLSPSSGSQLTSQNAALACLFDECDGEVVGTA
jgi:hypothetical protein